MHQCLMGTTKKITSAIAAIALLIMVTVVTFAFKSAPIKSSETVVWFSVNPTTGAINPTPLSGAPGCSGSTYYCGVSFFESDLDAGQAPISNVTADPDELIQQITRKDSL